MTESKEAAARSKRAAEIKKNNVDIAPLNRYTKTNILYKKLEAERIENLQGKVESIGNEKNEQKKVKIEMDDDEDNFEDGLENENDA
jgi:hypothetical protein